MASVWTCRAVKGAAVDKSVIGYWSEKAGEEPTEEDLRSLRSLLKHHPPGRVMMAIGEVCSRRGRTARDFALITLVAQDMARYAQSEGET